MKRIISLMALTAFLLTPTGVFAASQPTPIPVTVKANIQPVLVFTASTFKENADGSLTDSGGVIDFGNLTNVDASGNRTNFALRGQNAFHVFLGCLYNGGTKYTVSQSFAGLTGTQGTLPHSIGITGIDTASSGTGTYNIPVSSVAHPNQLTDAINATTIFTSSNIGDSVGLEIVYGYSGGTPNDANGNATVPFTGWQATPPGALAGSYSGTITYTMTVT